MKFLKSNITKIVVTSLIFPVSMVVMSFILRYQTINNDIWQMMVDLLVFLVAYLLNWKYLHENVSWIGKDTTIFQQLYTALPAFILIALMNSATLSEPDLTFKFKIVLTCLAIGLAEEYICRGLLLGLALKLFHQNVLGSVLFSSVIFGCLHLTNLASLPIGYVAGQVIFASAIGMLFGTVYVKTKSLWIVIGLHALRDMFPMFSPSLMKEAGQMQFSMVTLYTTIVMFAIAFFISYQQLKNFSVQK
ncbi:MULTISPECIES: CPBP family intramembrane glutamic endopeptidase [unclassified Companilactobacillus]|uniref:CPBP family intramembrane glutamic endopeptidase n=1 Tax=unclassified Companilactobacillus TaxID=2767904 RepID=UPI002FF1513C